MEFLSIYLLSIMGIVLLFVVIELILPNGTTSRYIRSMLGIFLIFVVIAPLGKLKNFDFDDVLSGKSAQYQLDYDYLYRVHLLKAEQMQQDIKNILKDKGLDNASVIVDVQKDSADLQINSIFVDLSQTVISKNAEHIINYTTIKDIVSEYACIDKNKVVINE